MSGGAARLSSALADRYRIGRELALAGWGWSAMQARRSATRAMPVEFDLSLPDSLEVTTTAIQPNGSA